MAKVKVKTHSGAKKRFKLTKNGKVKYQHTNKDIDLLKRIQRERESPAAQELQAKRTLRQLRS